MQPGEALFAEPVERLRACRQAADAAWTRLYRACYPQVLQAARRALGREMQSAYDPADFVADAMLELVRDFDRLEFPSLDAMIAYLQAQATSKIRQARRKDHPPA
jgi:DNA-directed RNA polymerase specialized sigma24 family protein